MKLKPPLSNVQLISPVHKHRDDVSDTDAAVTLLLITNNTSHKTCSTVQTSLDVVIHSDVHLMYLCVRGPCRSISNVEQ